MGLAALLIAFGVSAFDARVLSFSDWSTTMPAPGGSTVLSAPAS